MLGSRRLVKLSGTRHHTLMKSNRDKILEVGRAAAQAQGYGGLSFREIGKQVGISSASIHHHFPTKGDLGEALARGYREDAEVALAELSTSMKDPGKCLQKYIEGFRQTLENGNRMCLCGLLGAEYDNLPEPVRREIRAFADSNIRWLSAVLAQFSDGAPEKRISQDEARAEAIFAAIGGAQLAARSRGDITIYDRLIRTYRSTGLIPCDV